LFWTAWDTDKEKMMAHIIAQVAVEAAVDKTALDPKHKYFDAKSDPEKVA